MGCPFDPPPLLDVRGLNIFCDLIRRVDMTFFADGFDVTLTLQMLSPFIRSNVYSDEGFAIEASTSRHSRVW